MPSTRTRQTPHKGRIHTRKVFMGLLRNER
jgi:hypothetical protein